MIHYQSKTSENILSIVLKAGLYTAIAVSVFGAILAALTPEKRAVALNVFHGEPIDMTHFDALIKGVFALNPLCIIQLGLIILILTPILQVLTCLILFLIEKDKIYVFFSALVLTILLYSIV